jgi:hypothetical protein
VKTPAPVTCDHAELREGETRGFGAYEKTAASALEAIARAPWQLFHFHRLTAVVDEEFWSRLGLALSWREAHDWLLSLSEQDRAEFIDRLNESRRRD